MAGRFPGASSIDELWSLFAEGKEGIVTLPDQEPPPGGPALAPGPYVPRRGVIDNIDHFDPGFFRMSGAEADLLDPQHRLILEVCWEALEEAGLTDCEGQALGVFASTGISLYLLQNLLPNRAVIEQHGPLQLLLYNDKDTLATRLSYFLNVQGPSMTVQTGCSSSLVGLHLACRSLREGECTAALVAGVSLSLPQDVGYYYSEQMIHSRDGRCRAFDDDASGTVRGNGGCAVVIKRLADAIEARDHIWAVIKGSAVNNDGREKVDFTAPSPKGQAAVMTAALENAGVGPETIELIEAHGTGTPLGDPVEARALKNAFRDAAFPEGRKCAIGAAKATLGHLDTAAGLTGLIKACLSLVHEEIPPVLHFRKLNRHIKFDGTPFFVNSAPRGWPRRDTPRRAGISAFGIGGTNAHVIVEEAPPVSQPHRDAGPHLFTVSAASEAAFTALCGRYRERLAGLSSDLLSSFAFSTRVGRKALEHRAAFLASTVEQAMAALDSARPTAVKRRVRKLRFTDDTSHAAERLASRLTALGVDASASSRADLLLELRDGRIEISGVGERQSLSEHEEPRRFELELLAALWLRGVGVNWWPTSFNAHRLRIPTYPFARERHWIDPPEPGRDTLPDAGPARSPEPAAPRDFEALLSRILSEWRGLIGNPALRAEENLFEAGASSLMVGQFIANCRARHGLTIRAVDCYRDPTAFGLASRLTSLTSGSPTSNPIEHPRERDERLDDIPQDEGETFMDL